MKSTVLTWFIVLALPAVLLFAFFLFAGVKAYRKQNDERYDVLVHFPYELVIYDAPSSRLVRALAYLYALFDAAAGFYLSGLHELHPQLVSFTIILAILAVMKNAALAFLLSVPAYQFRAHIFAFTFFSALTVMQNALSCILLFNMLSANFALALTFAIATGLIALAALVLLLNPRLSQWTKLNAVVDQDGAVMTSRPRPFPLAATEWGFTFVSALGSVIALLGFFLLSYAVA